MFTRPDAAVVAAIALVSGLVLGPHKLNRRAADFAVGAGLTVLIPLPWEIFRIHYFHRYLPNTYYAKLYGIPRTWLVHSGLIYWRGFIFKPPYWVPLLLIVVCAMTLRGKWSRWSVALWACIVGHSLYIIGNGGDHMLAYRFMVPLVPLFAVALVTGLKELSLLGTATKAGLFLSY